MSRRELVKALRNVARDESADWIGAREGPIDREDLLVAFRSLRDGDSVICYGIKRAALAEFLGADVLEAYGIPGAPREEMLAFRSTAPQGWGIPAEITFMDDGTPALLCGRDGLTYEQGCFVRRWLDALGHKEAGKHLLTDTGPEAA